MEEPAELGDCNRLRHVSGFRVGSTSGTWTDGLAVRLEEGEIHIDPFQSRVDTEVVFLQMGLIDDATGRASGFDGGLVRGSHGCLVKSRQPRRVRQANRRDCRLLMGG